MFYRFTQTKKAIKELFSYESLIYVYIHEVIGVKNPILQQYVSH